MTITRKAYRLPEDVLEIIEQTKEEGGYATETETLISMIRSYNRQADSSITETDIDNIADAVATNLQERYKKTFDRIRLAASFAERYSYVILDAVNTMLYETEATFLMPASGGQEHAVVRESLAKFKEHIERNKQIKDNDNLKRG